MTGESSTTVSADVDGAGSVGSEESSPLTLAETLEPAVDAASATLVPAAEAAYLAPLGLVDPVLDGVGVPELLRLALDLLVPFSAGLGSENVAGRGCADQQELLHEDHSLGAFNV